MGVLRMVGINARADAHANPELTAVHDERALELFENERADALDLIHGIDVLADHGELIAPEARTEGARRRPLRTQALADDLKHAVAERMSQAVVDRLEVVEIDEQYRNARAAQSRAFERVLEVHE